MPYSGLTPKHKELAAQLRYALVNRGHGSVVFEPGNGTRIAIAAMRCSSSDFGGTLIVSLPDFKRSYPLQFGGHYDEYYLREKYDIGGSDLTAFTDFMNQVGESTNVTVSP